MSVCVRARVYIDNIYNCKMKFQVYFNIYKQGNVLYIWLCLYGLE